jgi:hypothetical protein
MSNSPKGAQNPQFDERMALPPARGWTLLEATAALCPAESTLFREGGPALEKILREAQGEWTELPTWPEGWLADHLHTALARRPDLVLTGRDLMKGADQPRTRLDHDVLEAALEDVGEQRLHLQLRLDENLAEIMYSFPEMRDGLPPDLELRQVRIEHRSSHYPAQGSCTGPLTTNIDQPSPLDDEQICREWFRSRVAAWPEGVPPPSARQCKAAAELHLGRRVRRDWFATIRGAVVPPSWLKPGPRGPRRPED